MNQNDYIAHWGIKGMKWGVRRYQNADGTYTDAGKKRRRNTDPYERDRVSSMSDEELRSRLNRMRMEKEYRDIANALKPKKQSRVKKILADIGENAVKTLASGAVNKISKNLFSDDKEKKKTNLNVKDVTKLSDEQLNAYNKRYAAESLAKKNSEQRLGEKAEERRYAEWLKTHKG